MPFLHFSIHITPWNEQQCTDVVRYYGLETVMNDYNANPARGPVQTNAVHDLFETPFTRPRLIVLNCVSNSSYNPQYQLIFTEHPEIADFPPDGVEVARWRAAIDSVQAPLPLITTAGIGNGGAFRFVFPGQRGRTNQVLGSSNLINWTVLTNVTGTNLPILFRDFSVLSNASRFYRIRRL
ncbi:MAG TPA: hypothetical protein VJ063_05705 [Verrucomicrobiae bacterium]|nr:hypothetical protein [Verrucomicrobiae bacterium]